MTDNSDGAKRAKKPRKLVPIVHQRQRRIIKKEVSSKTASELKSDVFRELAEAARTEAAWERGSARPRRHYNHVESHVTFGGTTAAIAARPESRSLVSSGIMEPKQTEIQLKKEDKDEQHWIEDELDQSPFCPMTIPIWPQSNEHAQRDAQKLLPRYLEERLAEVSSDDGEGTTAAHDLGLQLPTTDSNAMLFQLPSVLPIPARKNDDGSWTTAGDVRNLPEGRIGKLRIYRSGRVRLRLGDVSLDVDSGTPWPFFQQLVAINVREEDGHCVFLGDIRKRAICTLNVSQLIGSDSNSLESAQNVQHKRTLLTEDPVIHPRHEMDVEMGAVDDSQTPEVNCTERIIPEQNSLRRNLEGLTVGETSAKKEMDMTTALIDS